MTAAASGAAEAENPYADPAKSALPQTDVTVTLANTALVVSDSQIDFLRPPGAVVVAAYQPWQRGQRATTSSVPSTT